MKELYFLANGIAVGSYFSATKEEAISECKKTSRLQNSRNWLFKVSEEGKEIEAGYTVKHYDWRGSEWIFQENK